MEFDFDAWAKLAREDPAEFERQREATLRSMIASVPTEHRARLEGLQFRLDMERQRAGSPLGSCLRMNSLMWAGFHRLRRELNAASGAAPKLAEDQAGAEIISLQAARKRRQASEPSQE